MSITKYPHIARPNSPMPPTTDPADESFAVSGSTQPHMPTKKHTTTDRKIKHLQEQVSALQANNESLSKKVAESEKKSNEMAKNLAAHIQKTQEDLAAKPSTKTKQTCFRVFKSHK